MTTWRALWRHREGRLGIVLAVVLALLVLAGPLFAMDPDQVDYRAQLQAPGPGHLLGTDQAGRDLLARSLVGGTTSLGAAVTVFLITSAVGMLAGVGAALSGGVVDAVISRLIDIMLGLPSQVLALAIVGLLGPSFPNLILAMSITGWAGLARLARTCALGCRQEPYVQAARMAGVSSWRILTGHIIPMVWNQVMVLATLDIGSTILALSGLSFLGLGAQPPTAEWGNMLSEVRSTSAAAPWQPIGPGLGLFLSMAAAALIADGLRDVTEVGNAVA